MAFRRMVHTGKSLKPALSYKTVPNIPQNLSGFLNLEGYDRALSVTAISWTHFFLSYFSTLSNDKIHPDINLSMNMSTLPQGNEKFSKKFESEREDKRLLDIAINIHSEMVKTEEKLEEGEMLLKEIIGELKGFVSFLKWDFQDKKLNSVEDILHDVDSRFAKSFAALDKLSELIEGRKSSGTVIQNPFAYKIEDVLIDICSIKLRQMRSLEESKQKGKLLKEIVERRIRYQFYASFLFGGR